MYSILDSKWFNAFEDSYWPMVVTTSIIVFLGMWGGNM